MSPPRITIDVALSREGLLELREALDQLLRDLGESVDTAPKRDELAMQADRKVGEVWARVGDNIKSFLALGAQLNQPEDRTFTFEEIADALLVDVKTVRSWHRNLGRTLRQVDESIPEPVLMLGYWDGTRMHYQFPPEIRAAILARVNASAITTDAELRAIESQADRLPAVALRQAFDVVERHLREIVAGLSVEVPGDNPSGYDLIKIAYAAGAITRETGDALQGLVELRNLTAHDPSGTRTTPEKAREFIALARSTLYAMGVRALT